MKNDESELFKGLTALALQAFPKHCPSCGRIFNSVLEFLRETEMLTNHSGLKASIDENDKPIVEVYRNCVCGSTLMDFFNDRRDLSERGIRRRQEFERLLVALEQKGIERNVARAEILRVLRGERSEILGSILGRGNSK